MRKLNARELVVMSSVLFGALTGLSAWSGTLIERGIRPAVPGNTPAVTQQEQEEDVRQMARKAFMRGKLASNQKIVEGIAVKNFALIAEGAAEVKALVKGQHWFVLQTPEYREFSTEMQLAAERLEQAAQHQSIDGVTLRYFDLTLNCVDCHTYIEKQKY
jgi:hypothetical protein